MVFSWLDGRGHVTNSMVKLLALWALMKFALHQGVFDIKIYGDSKMITEWASGKIALHSLLLNQWGERVKEMAQSIDFISYHHIYRELNGTAYRLSKKALNDTPGLANVSEFKDNSFKSLVSLQFFEPPWKVVPLLQWFV